MSDTGITAINEKVKEESAFVAALRGEMEKVIVGQRYLIDRLMIGLLANGHLLLEGVPGLAKTLAVKTLAAAINTTFRRIQFTPDLLPADLVGTQVYNPKTGDFGTRKGPVFANIILADEINRAPAKVQSALLEAMEERQVTIGQETFGLPEPFLVLATQNPIEQEGTYPLPEAQVDRFMLKLVVTYPSLEEERRILDANARTQVVTHVRAVVDPAAILRARKIVDEIYVDDKIRTTSSPSSLPRVIPPPTSSTRSRTTSATAPRRARPSTSPSPPAPTPSSRAAATSPRRTSSPSRPTCCATASFPPSRPRPRK